MREELLLGALGPWNTILSPDEAYAGDRWRCSESMTDTLRNFFADMDEDGLARAVERFEESVAPTDANDFVKLIGRTLIRKASPPPLSEFIGPGLRDLLQYRAASSMMDQLARPIAALCEPPEWMTSEDVATKRADLTCRIGVMW